MFTAKFPFGLTIVEQNNRSFRTKPRTNINSLAFKGAVVSIGQNSRVTTPLNCTFFDGAPNYTRSEFNNTYAKAFENCTTSSQQPRPSNGAPPPPGEGGLVNVAGT